MSETRKNDFNLWVQAGCGLNNLLGYCSCPRLDDDEAYSFVGVKKCSL